MGDSLLVDTLFPLVVDPPYFIVPTIGLVSKNIIVGLNVSST